MRFSCIFLSIILLLGGLASVQAAAGKVDLIIAVGTSGEDEYSGEFAKWTANFQKAGAAGQADVQTIGAKAEEKDSLARLRTAVETASTNGTAPLWLVLLGHGTFDGREGKFNLRGDDLSASEISGWLKKATRPVVVICGFSASGAFLKPLSAPGRIIVTATKSGAENNFARFGGYFAEAINDPLTDLDHDGQVSVLEAWQAGAKRTAEFYSSDDRIATEHSLLEDNGDEFGTPADWYSGLRVVKKTRDQKAPDGLRAGQVTLVPSAAERNLSPEIRAQRDQLEADISKLRESKGKLEEKEYFARLEELLLQLARIYRGKPAS